MAIRQRAAASLWQSASSVPFSTARSISTALVMRARIMLATADQELNSSIARHLQTTRASGLVDIFDSVRVER